MADLIVSVSGLRGIIGENLTPDLAARFACAYAAGQPDGPFVLARDGRATGPMLADAVRAALLGTGRDVLDAGIAATPTVGVLLREYRAAGAVQISASHNPPEYNGIKLFAPTGQVLSAASGEDVLRRFQDGQVDWVDYRRIGHSQAIEDTLLRHADLVLKTIDPSVVRRARFRVLLDSNHASGSLLGKRLLEQLGCQVLAVGDEPDGQFAHPPEPIADNLGGICRQVIDAGVDVGFCQDPDADRLAVIDQTGRYLGEEYTLALCLDQVLRERPGPVVTNCSTSRMAEDLARKYSVPFFLSPVGEANVVQVMRDQQAVFGGEGNGGPIDPQVGFIRDSFVGMAWILYAMASREAPVSQLADDLPRYQICKRKQAVDRARISKALAALEDHFGDAQPSRMDGLRLTWNDRWLLVRASNTEPIIRIIAEATTVEQSQKLCDEAATVIGSH